MAELVLVEVYVTDKRGRTLRGLQVEDFILRIDGARKPISSLEYIETFRPEETRASGAPEAHEVEAADEEIGQVPVRRFPRRFLLFFEDSTSAPGGMTDARMATQEFIASSLAPDDQVALVAYDRFRKMRILMDFTSDRGALQAALQKSLEDTRRISDHARELDDRRREIWLIKRTPTFGDASTGAAAARARAQSYARMGEELISRILDSMRSLVDSLAAWPGYRALVFIGEGFPDNSGTSYGIMEGQFDLSDQIGILAHSAAASGVTLHSISTQGLFAGQRSERARAGRRVNTLKNLALTTGGMALTSNDVRESLATMEQTSRAYYLIGYEPEGPPDGRYHSVTVRVRGANVRHRGGFHRMFPEQARERAIQAAHVLPELCPDLGLELLAVSGPSGVAERTLDLVLYLPAKQVIFVPKEGKLVARLEVGLVALDRNGEEALRVAQQVRLGLSPDLDLSGPLGFNFFGRVNLPTTSQMITAVVSDLQGKSIAATRLAMEPLSPDASDVFGLSMYSLAEQSVWVELDPEVSTEEGVEIETSYTKGPASRRSFTAGEEVVCGFRLPPAREGGPSEWRLRIFRGEEIVRSHELPTEINATADIVKVPLPIQGLEAGDYRVLIQERIASSGQVVDRGSLPLTIR